MAPRALWEISWLYFGLALFLICFGALLLTSAWRVDSARIRKRGAFAIWVSFAMLLIGEGLFLAWVSTQPFSILTMNRVMDVNLALFSVGLGITVLAMTFLARYRGAEALAFAMGLLFSVVFMLIGLFRLSNIF